MKRIFISSTKNLNVTDCHVTESEDDSYRLMETELHDGKEEVGK